MTTTQVQDLIREINAMLSRPLGSAQRGTSLEAIAKREELKQLRSYLEALREDQSLSALPSEWQQVLRRFLSDPDRLDITQPFQIGTDSVLFKEANPMPQPADQPLAQTIERVLQEVLPPLVQSQIQHSIQQSLQQIFAVERALIVGEITAQLKNNLEQQRRSLVGDDLQNLMQQKQRLHQELEQLERERQQMWLLWQQDLQQRPKPTAEATPSYPSPHFQEEVQAQTDHFLINFDTLLNSTLRSLQQELSAYESNVQQKLAQMADLEQRSMTLAAALIDRLDQVVITPTAAEPTPEPETREEPYPSFLPTEHLDEELISQLLGHDSPDLVPDLDPMPESMEPQPMPELGLTNPAFELWTPDLPDVAPPVTEAELFLPSSPETTEVLEQALAETEQSAEDDLVSALAQANIPLNFDPLPSPSRRDPDAPPSDDVSDSDDSLILLPDVPLEQTATAWDDALLDSLCQDMDDLESGVGANPSILLNLDQHIRKTPLYDLIDQEIPNFDEPLPPEPVDLIPELGVDPPSSAAEELSMELDALDLMLSNDMELPADAPENPMLAMLSETAGYELDQILNGMSRDFSLELDQMEEEPNFDEPTVLESADNLLTEIESPEQSFTLEESPDPLLFLEQDLAGDRLAPNDGMEVWADFLALAPEEPSPDPDWQELLSDEEQQSLNAFADDPSDTPGPDLLDSLGMGGTPADDFLSFLADPPSEEPALEPSADSEEDPFAFLTVEPDPLMALEPVDLLLNEFADRGEVTAPIAGMADEVPPPTILPERYSRDDRWYLGIDFGTTGIRACLGNAGNGRHYALMLGEETSLSAGVHLASNAPDPTDESLPLDPEAPGFKPLMKVGLPYRGINGWQPVMGRVNGRLILAGLQSLLRTLPEQATHPMLPELPMIFQNLRGVVLAHPTHWSDTYGFNLREAVLRSGLVHQPDQVLVVEEAIAPFLYQHHRQAMVPHLALYLNGGATTTHLTLARIFDDRPKRHDLFERGLDFGGEGITQDLVTQLLYPQWQALPHEPPLPQRQLPRVPEPADPSPRDRLLWQQFLQQDDTGRGLLAAAESAKRFFSQQATADEWQQELLGVPLSLTRREFESRIMQPYIQRLNREVNLLLSLAGITGSDLTQVFYLGGTFQIASLHRWLGQKFPNAQIEPLAATALAEGLAIAPSIPNCWN
ncbi:MAG: hypothetical protein HC919_13795 [Oscillatoriales cyanobacterium SM2_2_1]|nr:hypothetical protein [Oscillatoriales cyanobacterium SM2_2_1]